MKHFITCKSCGTRVSRLLNNNIVLPEFRGFREESLLVSGQYCIDGDGDIYIAIADKHALKYHPDESRMIGCCGPNMEGLPNLVCSCKAAMGREASDCDYPHFIKLFHSSVNLKADENGLLEALLHAAVSDEEKASLEILLHYGQEDELKHYLNIP